MSAELYKDMNFRPDTLALIRTMNDIVADYVAQGFVLTVRQLYYQLVARDVVPNTEKSYGRICETVNNAKLAGYMDWDAIEDRARAFIRRNRWGTVAELVRACAEQFHMDMWENQHSRVFVVVEKEALAGVLEGVCREYDCPLLAARGYPSGTVLRAFCEEDILPALDAGQMVEIIHLGDHDPSGIDMTRDLTDRLQLFTHKSDYRDQVNLTRIALNMEQIRKFKPPPNPAKLTDSRFAGYASRYGDKSWELDALSPSTLADLVKREVKKHIDGEAWDERKALIEDRREIVSNTAAEFEEKEI